jgi:hypothetical protein
VPTEMDLYIDKHKQEDKPYVLWETTRYRAVLDGRYLHFEQRGPDRMKQERWEECEAEYAIRSLFHQIAMDHLVGNVPLHKPRGPVCPSCRRPGLHDDNCDDCARHQSGY